MNAFDDICIKIDYDPDSDMRDIAAYSMSSPYVQVTREGNNVKVAVMMMNHRKLLVVEERAKAKAYIKLKNGLCYFFTFKFGTESLTLD